MIIPKLIKLISIKFLKNVDGKRKEEYVFHRNSFCFLGVLLILRECLHEISFRATWNIFNSVSGQSLMTVYMKHATRNPWRMLFHCGPFDRNFILRDFVYYP